MVRQEKGRFLKLRRKFCFAHRLGYFLLLYFMSFPTDFLATAEVAQGRHFRFLMTSRGIWEQRELNNIEKSLLIATDTSAQPFRDRSQDNQPEFSTASIISKNELSRLCYALRRSEDDLVAESGLSSEASPSVERDHPLYSYTFDIDKQKRPGAHHGCGGRPRALTTFELQATISPQIARKLCQHHLRCCNGRIEDVSSSLRVALLIVIKDDSSKISVDIPENCNKSFDAYARNMCSVKERKGYEVVQAPFLCVCFKVPKSGNIDSGSGNPMDRHAACTWLDLKGLVHCTCVGSTSYRVKRAADKERSQESCVHASGILRVVSAISAAFTVSQEIAGKMLSKFIILSMESASTDLAFPRYTSALPTIHFSHNRSVIIVAAAEAPHDPNRVMFVPVRHITKGSVRNVCAFCDNVIDAVCHHTRTIALLQNEVDDEESYTTDLRDTKEVEGRDSISCLPLYPVNCQKALRIDETVSDLARKARPYIATAPLLCPSCGSPRDDETQKLWTGGVLMSTIGPCRMITEEFQCSSNLCRATIMSEGRDHCILMDRVTSAATHALLRRELYGVVISNGSLTGRLRHFHSLVTANAFFGIIPDTPECRSVKTLIRLCSGMLKLMCMSPPTSLFRCQTCEYDVHKKKEQLKSLSMDGISQGFIKGSAKPFQNISEPCVSTKPSTSISEGRAASAMRPLTCLVREAKPVRILLDAIRGKSLSCSKLSEKNFTSAIRMVSNSAVPPSFYSSISVCGKSRGDVSNDIGFQSVLEHIRNLTTALFDENTLLFRLLGPLIESVQDRAMKHYLKLKRAMLHSAQARDVVCWRSNMPDTNDGHARNDVFNLFLLIIQGPILQFVQKSDTTHLKDLSDLCLRPHPDDLQKVLQHHEQSNDHSESCNMNIIRRLKILRAGIFSVTEVERLGAGSAIRKSVGDILRDCVNLVLPFYAFYDGNNRSETAFEYKNLWCSTNQSDLTRLLHEKYGPCHKLLVGNEYELATRTGSYFPGRPQIRPLPFNDEEVTNQDFDNIDSCSKDFLQRQNSFTPGALTFCCSCSSPKILGFKVLYRNEGPRAVIDTVISRFCVTPRHLVYDFCCGLFISTIHCLWWALCQVAVVCDKFHIKNHSCSPGYSPKAHSMLQATNTVSHEQRNRAISRLGCHCETAGGTCTYLCWHIKQ